MAAVLSAKAIQAPELEAKHAFPAGSRCELAFGWGSRGFAAELVRASVAIDYWLLRSLSSLCNIRGGQGPLPATTWGQLVNRSHINCHMETLDGYKVQHMLIDTCPISV